MAQAAIWHGTPDESRDLSEALARNCTCQFGLMGIRTSECALHTAYEQDQRFLDGLLFARRRLAKEQPGASKREVLTR